MESIIVVAGREKKRIWRMLSHRRGGRLTNRKRSERPGKQVDGRVIFLPDKTQTIDMNCNTLQKQNNLHDAQRKSQNQTKILCAGNAFRTDAIDEASLKLVVCALAIKPWNQNSDKAAF